MSNAKFDFEKFHIGTYVMGPKTVENLHDMKNAGIDIVIDGGFSKELLDEFDANGMGVFLSHFTPTTKPIEEVESSVLSVPDHPAIWALDVRDEPSDADLVYYGPVCEAVEKASKGKLFAYVNLYPGIVFDFEALGERNYEMKNVHCFKDYVEAFAKQCKVPYICFDEYVYSDNYRTDPHLAAYHTTLYYHNLYHCAEVCRAYGRHLWIVIQANVHNPANYPLHEYEMRYQACTVMAFGADLISWACWSPGWWHYNILDKDGNKTESYDKLKHVNEELHAVGKAFERYRNVSTYLVGFSEGTPAHDHITTFRVPYPNLPTCKSVCTKAFKNVSCPKDYSILVGSMTSKEDGLSEALFISDATNPHHYHEPFKITFDTVGESAVTMYKGTEKRELAKACDGLYHIEMDFCQGFLITLS